MLYTNLKFRHALIRVFLFSLFLQLPVYSYANCGNPEEALQKYRNSLNEFRLEYGGSREMPDVTFFLFGMGNRTKLVYKNGTLKNAISGEIVKKWDISKEIIVPPDYSVYITLTDGSHVSVVEDGDAVWITENDTRIAVAGTETKLRLPDFEEYRYPGILKVLHQEILINIIDGKPVPNFFVYTNPWRRDGAMMAMCLHATGNIDLIKNWALSLEEPYDRNNAGVTEADNLGETLFILSFFTNKDFPLVTKILEESKKFEIINQGNKYIKGLTDDHEVPAYQTKWLKFGLKSMDLPDDYTIPGLEDNYSALFWWDYKDSYKPGTLDADDKNQYPYLGWACDNFHGKKAGPISNRDYPLTWEIGASEANYDGMSMIDEKYVSARNSSPHTWHASEVFLYLLKYH